MCGRYASTRSSTDLATLFDALDTTDEALVPDYNLAPTDPAPIVRMSASAGVDGRSASSRAGADGRSASSRAGARVLSVARWGLVPAWSADGTGGARMINARAETVATSKAFAPSFERRRCLVPADGWYEWARTARANVPSASFRDGAIGRSASSRDGAIGRSASSRDGAIGRSASSRAEEKQPYFMTRRDGQPLVFGGVWSTWGTQLLTFSVITLPAVGELARVHDRMPLVLSPDRWQDWLADADPLGLLRPPAEDYAAGIELRPVSAAVGDVRNDGPDLIEPITLRASQSTMETLF